MGRIVSEQTRERNRVRARERYRRLIRPTKQRNNKSWRFDEPLGKWLKKCPRCEEVKTEDEYPPSTQGRRYPICRVCKNARDRGWQKDHLQKFRINGARYRERHHEEVKERKRRRYANFTPEQREHHMAQGAMRRARKYTDKVELVTRSQIVARDGEACYLCGASPARSPTLDHVIPLKRGGEHTAANLRVACKKCNDKKARRLLSELTWGIYGEINARKAATP
jgi:5-methylcytosine-specific restriction endonuclease McrA